MVDTDILVQIWKNRVKKIGFVLKWLSRVGSEVRPTKDGASKDKFFNSEDETSQASGQGQPLLEVVPFSVIAVERSSSMQTRKLVNYTLHTFTDFSVSLEQSSEASLTVVNLIIFGLSRPVC
ncbi:hypothetical protein TNCV_257131 [Trichonephila clavipes]|nr:hypothetical protein TNCV_257131 [Trichonephila clavipes]